MVAVVVAAMVYAVVAAVVTAADSLMVHLVASLVVIQCLGWWLVWWLAPLRWNGFRYPIDLMDSGAPPPTCLTYLLSSNAIRHYPKNSCAKVMRLTGIVV